MTASPDHVLVPREPTEEMLSAFWNAMFHEPLTTEHALIGAGYDAMIAAAPALPSNEQGWRPIETLPHDGDDADREKCGFWAGPVLVFVPDEHGGVQLVAQCDSDMWLIGDDERCFAEMATPPTHWMPLPPPPASP